MKTEPTSLNNITEDKELQALKIPPQPKRNIYPEVNDRVKGAFIWLGLAFVMAVFLVQYFSGYS